MKDDSRKNEYYIWAMNKGDGAIDIYFTPPVYDGKIREWIDPRYCTLHTYITEIKVLTTIRKIYRVKVHDFNLRDKEIPLRFSLRGRETKVPKYFKKYDYYLNVYL